MPRPFARLFAAALIYLGMLSRKFRFIGPRIIQISLPAGCDHNCAFCITEIHNTSKKNESSEQSDKPKSEFQIQNFQSVCKAIDKALAQGTLNFNLVSDGEPMLYPKIKELIEYIAKKSRRRANIKLITNGTSLDRIGVEFAYHNHVYFWVSLHAGDFETWAKIHRPIHSANKKYEALKSFLKAICKQDAKRVTLHNVIHKDNQYSLKSIVDFATEVGAKDLFFGRLYKFPDLQLSSEEEIRFYENLKTFETELAVKGIKNNISTFERVAFSKKAIPPESTPQKVKELSSDYYKKNNCYINWLLTLVDNQGNYQFCGAGPFTSNHTSQSLINESQLRIQAAYISFRRQPVDDCDCSNCPHIQMNEIANRYLPKSYRNML